MLDPADCGPAFIALPQDVQAQVYDFPAVCSNRSSTRSPARGPTPANSARPSPPFARPRRPLIVAGGGVHYSLAEEVLASFAERHGVPVVETVAGKSTLTRDHPCYAGPIGVIGAEGANRLAAEADVVLAVGTRLGDFATGSWSVFQIPTSASSASTRRASTPTSTCRCRSSATPGSLSSSSSAGLDDWRAPEEWTARVATEVADAVALPRPAGRAHRWAADLRPGRRASINERATADDYALTASGGFPGELNNGWRSHAVATFDCEYGFSCMGYEMSGGWGAAMARAPWPPTATRSCSSVTART